MVRKLRNITKGRLVGSFGSSIPVVGDVFTLGYIKKHAGKAKGIGAGQGLKYVGGPMAVVGWSTTGYGLYQEGWRIGQKRVNIPGGSNFVRVPRIYKKSNRVSGRKNGLGGPVRDPKATNRFARRRRKLIPRTGRKCPNGYRYDPKRKMCVYKG